MLWQVPMAARILSPDCHSVVRGSTCKPPSFHGSSKIRARAPFDTDLAPPPPRGTRQGADRGRIRVQGALAFEFVLFPQA